MQETVIEQQRRMSLLAGERREGGRPCMRARSIALDERESGIAREERRRQHQHCVAAW